MLPGWGRCPMHRAARNTPKGPSGRPRWIPLILGLLLEQAGPTSLVIESSFHPVCISEAVHDGSQMRYTVHVFPNTG